MSRKQHRELRFAVCAESAEERQLFKAYLVRRRWNDTGHEYAATSLNQLFEEAGRGAFNAAFINVGGVRWFAQIVPDREFPKPEAKAKPATEEDPPPSETLSPLETAIVDRARSMTIDGPKSAEAIAEALIQDKCLKGNVAKAGRQVRRALLRSRAFCVSNSQDGQPPTWAPWQPRTHAVDEPGRRTIYTEVLSTTGVPVQITIPLKPWTEIARMLLQGVLPDDQASRLLPIAEDEPER